ncbi:barstar family protein [Rhodococcus oxybenzonivorans]|uniref:barstar family protein n=1 Tax=Rhodococcus oxybenzonivorans TaxID=1990687 RepID=UPI00295527FC|nr:barstar family protein [Rhodococcus oxybenzonivorans]MDV7352808.1 barstar family protein [Rhodococcus oxybenzonivorans]
MSKTDAVYVIDGRLVHSLADFYTIVGETVSGTGGYFGRSLDAFSDCLIGGYGTPADGRFRFVWQYSGESRSALGYAETMRQLEDQLEHCHPDHKSKMHEQLERAIAAEGPTVFDWLVDIFQVREVELELQ